MPPIHSPPPACRAAEPRSPSARAEGGCQHRESGPRTAAPPPLHPPPPGQLQHLPLQSCARATAAATPGKPRRWPACAARRPSLRRGQPSAPRAHRRGQRGGRASRLLPRLRRHRRHRPQRPGMPPPRPPRAAAWPRRGPLERRRQTRRGASPWQHQACPAQPHPPQLSLASSPRCLPPAAAQAPRAAQPWSRGGSPALPPRLEPPGWERRALLRLLLPPQRTDWRAEDGWAAPAPPGSQLHQLRRPPAGSAPRARASASPPAQRLGGQLRRGQPRGPRRALGSAARRLRSQQQKRRPRGPRPTTSAAPSARAAARRGSAQPRGAARPPPVGHVRGRPQLDWRRPRPPPAPPRRAPPPLAAALPAPRGSQPVTQRPRRQRQSGGASPR